MFLLASLALSAVLEVTPENISTVIGSNLFSFVSFFAADSYFTSDDFAAASDALPRVAFARVNCTAQPTICATYNVTSLPALNFYFPTRTAPLPFTGPHAFDSYCDFLANLTHYTPTRPFNALLFLTKSLYEQMSQESECLLVSYYDPSSPRWKAFYPEARSAARVFLADYFVKIAALQCRQYSEACDQIDIDGLKIRLWKKGEIVEFRGNETTDGIIAFVNEKCGTDRGPDGLLGDSAGITEEGRALVAEFMGADDKTAIFDRVKTMKGFEYYAVLMNRYIKEGIFSLQKAAADLLMHMEATKGRVSWQQTDTMKKNYNIVRLFAPKTVPVQGATDAEAAANGGNDGNDKQEL